MNPERFDTFARALGASTSRRAALKFVAATLIGGVAASGSQATRRAQAQAAQTALILTNSSGSDVLTYITLGVPLGCVSNVARLPFVTNVVNTLQGSFTLKSGASITYAPPAGQCLNGNISFGTPPMNCPTTDFPNGINLAEFNLNNVNQGAGAQETIDNSAVSGVNATIGFKMTGGGPWNAGSTKPNVTSFQNQGLRANAGLVGVYPWGCDNCIARTDPPRCTTPYDGACQAQPICNVQRDASTAGGTVEIIFSGFLGSGQSCGAIGQPCCVGNTCTAPGSICRNGLCQGSGTNCGALGQPCCSGGACSTPGGVCRNGSCQASGSNCGLPGQPCCANTTCSDATNVCSRGTCQPCGRPGQLCCAGNACSGICTNGNCLACGLPGQPCCAGSTCTDVTNVCSRGACQPCGLPGQPCCAGSTCTDVTNVCSRGICQPCGRPSQLCCAGGNCTLGTCTGGTCRT